MGSFGKYVFELFKIVQLLINDLQLTILKNTDVTEFFSPQGIKKIDFEVIR